MQNHLLQVLVLCAMEPPKSDAPSDIQAAKVEVLKNMSIPSLDDAFLAQYTEDNFMSEPGYLEDPGVPDSPGKWKWKIPVGCEGESVENESAFRKDGWAHKTDKTYD